MDLKHIVILITWAIFFVTFVRAVRKGKVFHSSEWRIWLQFFLSILAFSFWGEAAEASLDHHFGNLPVALYLKYVCLIMGLPPIPSDAAGDRELSRKAHCIRFAGTRCHKLGFTELHCLCAV